MLCRPSVLAAALHILAADTSDLVAEGITSHPLTPPTHEHRKPLFDRLTVERTGLDFVHQWNQAPRFERLLNSSVAGGGVCVGDYDGDGLPDVFLTRATGGNQLYRNLCDFRFTNVTEKAGVADTNTWGTGATFADVNNDGRLDLYLCAYESPNRLYVNQGNGTLVEQAKAFGLDFNGASVMAAFADYDRDGDLDCYLMTAGLIPKPHQKFRAKFIGNRPTVPEELQEVWALIYQPGDRASLVEAGQFDHLYRNNGNGTFTEVSKPAGIAGAEFGNAAVWWDYDDDGWPDLYVANDYFGPDHLYHNHRDGTFTDVAQAALPHTPWTSMGADAADLNNDGLLDFIATDMLGTTHFKRQLGIGSIERNAWFLDLAEPRQYMRNALYLNTGTPRFMEAAYLAGLTATDWTWSPLLGDLDNDGWVDLFVSNGMTRDWMDSDLGQMAPATTSPDQARFWKNQPKRIEANLAFKNGGDLRFQNVSHEWGLDYVGVSFGAALADFNGDGNLDLVVNNFEEPAGVFRNRGGDSHRLLVRLKGTASNRFGLGATVRLETPSGRQMRQLTLARGFASSSEPLAHFGLSRDARINTLTVEWPSGHRQRFDDLAADHLYTITEPSGHPAPVFTPKVAPMFAPFAGLTNLTHEATLFDDFQREPLLPFKLSQLGPGMAWGDVDSDDDDDLYLGGTTKKPGELWLNDGHGKFHRDPEPASAPAAEEMAPLFLDADADGDMDLYVVTGGIACEPGDAVLRDRIFLNHGKGHFAPAPPDRPPDVRDSGSVAAAADFDRDGDLDLFVGSRSIPGRYPVTAHSRLLRNESGQFTDATDELASGLGQAGLVTSAIWSDANGDAWLDLLVTCEWGPVKLSLNENGKLKERTREAGLADRLGWWNGIAARDLDNDGDVDFVVTNFRSR